MAKEIIINAKINTGNSAQDVKNLEVQMSSLNQELEQGATATTDFEQDLLKLDKAVDSGELSMRELTKKIKEYQDIAYKAGLESAIGKDAILKASQLKDNLNAVREQTVALADGEQNFKAAVTLGEGIVQGYQGFLGVSTLLGNENERLVETLTKLQAAQGVVNSLSAIRGALDNESIVVIKAKMIATRAAAAAESLYGAAVGTSTGALKVFRLALIGTGIGAIIVGLGLLVANWEKFVDWVETSIDKLREYKNYIAFVLPVLYLLIEGYDLLIGALQKAGLVMTEEQKKAIEQGEKRIEQLEKERKAIGDRYDFEIAKLKAAGKETYEVEQEKRKAILETIKTQALAIQEQVRLTGEFTDEQKESLKSLTELAKKTAQEITIASITEEKARNDKAIELAKERATKLKEQKKALDEIEKEEKQALLEEETIDFETSENQRRERDAVAFEEARAYNRDLKALNDEEMLIAEENAKAKKQYEQDVFAAKTELASMATSAILANMEQGSNAAKGIAAAQVVFDTYRGIQSTFASAAANPTSILFPAQPYIQAGIAAAFGFANVRKILSSSPAKASGGGSASASGGGGGGAFTSPSMAAPKNQINMFGQGFTGGEILADKKKTYKVEVNANEISAAQSSNSSQSNFASL